MNGKLVIPFETSASSLLFSFQDVLFSQESVSIDRGDTRATIVPPRDVVFTLGQARRLPSKRETPRLV